jgi:methionine-gamma-lyase
MKTFDPIRSFADLRHEFGEHGGVNMSVEASTTFTVLDPGTMPEIFQGHLGPDVGGCYLYGRHFNPTVYVLGRQIAAYEGAEAGYCTASGMAAISAVITQLCDTGDQVVASRTVYGGTFALLHDYLPAKAGVATTFVDVSDLAGVERAFTPRTRVLYCETVSNPTLRVADIPALAAIAHRHGAIGCGRTGMCDLMKAIVLLNKQPAGITDGLSIGKFALFRTHPAHRITTNGRAG